MTPPTFEIRPGLCIEIQPVADSVRLRWCVAGALTCLFDPSDGTWQPEGHESKTRFEGIAPADLALIEARLRLYAEERRRQLAAQHVTALLFFES